MGGIGELDVVLTRPLARVTPVGAEVVQHEVQADIGRIERAQVATEGQELEPALLALDVAVEPVAPHIEGAQQVAHPVRTGVGGPDASRLGPRRPGPATRLGLEVQGPELIQADDDGRAALGQRVQLQDAVLLGLKSGSFERFQVLTA